MSRLITANYTDPAYEALRQRFGQRSSEYPVALLPVRLETKFVNETRVKVTRVPGLNSYNALIKRLHKLHYEVEKKLAAAKGTSASSLKAWLKQVADDLKATEKKVKKLPELSGNHKNLLRIAVKELQEDFASLAANKNGLSKSFEPIFKAFESLKTAVDTIASPQKSIYEPGYQYLETLEALEKNIDQIYYERKIPSAQLDEKLNAINAQIKSLEEQIKTPSFRATEGTINKISSKVSYLKRRQKKAPITLTAYKKMYGGKRDLKTYNHVLQTKLATLKQRVDQQHVPYMQIAEELQRYPVRLLNHRIDRAYGYLKAQNESRQFDYESLMAVKEELYSYFLAIRERAHRPLEGSPAEIKELKKSYGQLEKQVQSYLNKAAKIKSNDRYEKAALTRLNTHLTEEYLEDLKDLLPNQKPLKEQLFSDFKLRTTTTAATKSANELRNVSTFLKTTRASSQKAALSLLNKRLEDAKNTIKISASNTHLLPRKNFLSLQDQLNSLRSQYRNALKNNKIPKNSKAQEKGWQLIDDLSKEIENQQVDVFDQRDRFYDSYRKRVTFITHNETIKELWVRIFPDDVAINNHDEQLTANEVQVSKDYYYEIYNRPENEREGAQLGAWRAAAASMGVRRAAYALRQMLPQEVSSNNIATRQNQLASFWKKIHHNLPQNSKLFRTNNLALPSEKTIEKALTSLSKEFTPLFTVQKLTPCLENRGTIKTVLNQLSSSLEFCKAALQTQKTEVNIKQLSAWISTLQNAHDFATAYFKTYQSEFNKPYSVPLTFPQINTKEKSWGKAAISEVMPHHFVVATMRKDKFEHIVTGKPVPQPLPIGFDPTGDQADRWYHDEKGDLKVPDELSWMFNFEAAVDAGLGIRIPLQDTDFEQGFDTVLCLGLRETSALSGQQDLENLLTNHLYSDGGLEFLPVDTPTNNTDEVKSAYNGLDNDFDAANDLFMGDENLEEIPNTPQNELSVSDGQLFREALGLPADLVGDMRHFAKKDIAEGRAMNRALINGTLKYFMAIMAPNLFNSADRENTLIFMVQHLSAVGNLPSVRVDEQPYGFLPITATSHFEEGVNLPKGSMKNYVHQLGYFLRSLKDIYENLETKPSTVNGQRYQNDPQAEFLKILGLSPFSQEFYYRAGSNVAKRWQTPENIDFPINWDNNEPNTPSKLAQAFLSSMNYKAGVDNGTLHERIIESTRAYTNRFFEAGFVNGALVQDERLGRDKLAHFEASENNYIDWLKAIVDLLNDADEEQVLRSIDFNAIPHINHTEGPIKQNTLLLLMLRGALIYDRSSYAINALSKIAELSVPKLERLLANHIDLCSYRLDAWLSGLANYRLQDMRKAKSKGTYLGAYGFVSHLKPAAPRERAQHVPQDLAPADGNNVYKMPDNQGFIHGPSLNHAVTAAVLRAGYTSLKSKGNNNNALAVNLSSARVRKALFLMEGVSQGQEIGALLGYQLERALHDKYTNSSGQPLEMNVYIHRLRRKFPTYGNRSVEDANSSSVDEQLRPTNVVDGLAMIDYFEDWLKDNSLYDEEDTFVEMMISGTAATPSFNGYPWGLGNEVPNPAAPASGSTAADERKKLKALIYELDNMADAFDAMADLTTAEGVYQLVKGNHVRAGAVLKAMAEGTRPVDPEIIKSMRQGVSVTHRATLNFNLQETNPWPHVALTAKAKAAPNVNNWLAQQIGAPENTEWQVQQGHTISFLNLGDIGLQPIDWVMLIGLGNDDSQAEIQNRCLAALEGQGAATDEEIILNFNEASNSNKLSLGEQIALLQSLGQALAKGRPADARDYRDESAEANSEPGALGIDLDHLQNHLDGVLVDYRQLAQSLTGFSATQTSYTPTEISLAADKLKELSQWGFSGYYPTVDASLEETISKIVSAKSQMNQHLNWADAELAKLALETDELPWIRFSAEFATKFHGSGFKILPRISVDNHLDIQQQAQLAHEDGPLRHHPNSGFLDQWLSTAALVRKDLASIESARLLGDALHQNACSITAVQLPFSASVPVAQRDYWLGAEYPESYKPEGDRLSLISFGVENLQEITVGLVLDEWMELIPDAAQTTGIAFHFNQPDARAPQNVLLAVPARNRQQWDTDELLLTVHEALRQAKIRAVEPEHIDFSVLSQMLPATTTLAHGANRLNDGTDLGGFIDYSFVNKTSQTEK